MFVTLDFTYHLATLLMFANAFRMYEIDLTDNRGCRFSVLSTSEEICDTMTFVAKLADDRWFCGQVLPEEDGEKVSNHSYRIEEVTTHSSLSGALRWLKNNI